MRWGHSFSPTCSPCMLTRMCGSTMLWTEIQRHFAKEGNSAVNLLLSY